MRTSLLALLLITAAAPSFAKPGDHDRGDRAASERTKDARPDRNSEEGPRIVRARSSEADSDRPRQDRQHRRMERMGEHPARAPVETRGPRAESARQADAVRSWRERERTGKDRLKAERRDSLIRDEAVRRERWHAATKADDRRQRVDLSRAAIARKWRSDWRRDHRYDWRSHRARNRSLFRFGFYYDPFGYSYRRFGYGHTLFPAYYGNRYWLNDPFAYRLPHVGYPYRWVRYWDDALLVDMRSGMVVDVLYDVFW